MNPPLGAKVEACPIDERKVLQDGTTRAVPYPKGGFNCNPYSNGGTGNLSQKNDIKKNEEVKAKINDECKGVKPFDTELFKPYNYKP